MNHLRNHLLLAALCLATVAFSQKKPLDHTVYDAWESIGERLVSHDGKWIVYTIMPQEGDANLVIRSAEGSYRKTIQRGYGAVITEDSRYLICRIKPFFRETREARIRKKKAEDMPKDSLAIVKLGSDALYTIPRVKSFRTPEKSWGWVAFHLEKNPETVSARPKPATPDLKRVADSLGLLIDSLRTALNKPVETPRKKRNRDWASAGEEDVSWDAEGDDPAGAPSDSGTDLVLRNLDKGEQRTFVNVVEYYFSRNGSKLLVEGARNPRDSASYPYVLLFDLRKGFGDTLSRGGNEYRNFALADDGCQVAYLAERDARPRELQKYYRLWYFREGMDSANLLVDHNSVGMKLGMTVSEYGNLSFSKSGKRLFFGVAPIQEPRDTTRVDFETARLDIWHYNDDYLQTVQLNRLQRDLQENYLSVYLFDQGLFRQLGSKQMPVVYATNEGDGDQFVAVTDWGKRIESQWTGSTKKDIYTIDVASGTSRLVRKDLDGVLLPNYLSPSGRFLVWYDYKARHYFLWDGTAARNISSAIRVPLYNEENDLPDDPAPYGVMGWQEGDSAVYVYDRYDTWRIPTLPVAGPPVLFGPSGRKEKKTARYVRLNSEERYICSGQLMAFRVFSDIKKNNYYVFRHADSRSREEFQLGGGAFNYSSLAKSRDALRFVFQRENFQAADLFTQSLPTSQPGTGLPDTETAISALNPQQQNYVWGTAELFTWKTFKGKPTQGIVYKPENFDPAKKYPLLIYFYEQLTDGLYNYLPPSPTPSRLNIPFFVSRGYIVLAPDIRYTIGHPAQSAYDYIVSGAQALARFKWIDAKNMGIQGQSWGGIQVAQLVTMTGLFKAAWAGAPVANMTSAYGGIRWESGVNRQFQYERTQSRIGATLWQRPDLFIENSPLFHLPKVTTPLVIMANDADGAVPWYQGIEMFTAMRRLGKKVWLLNYNGEAHNLVERRNRKDIQIREQQYFDWLLKGEKPARWITEGVPATQKGRDWGLDLVE